MNNAETNVKGILVQSIKISLIVAIFIGALAVGYLNMLYNNPQLATPADMALMMQETAYTIIAVASAVTVYIVSKYNKLVAIVGGILALIFSISIGYGEYNMLTRQTLDIGVWASVISLITGIAMNTMELTKSRRFWQTPRIHTKGAGG